MSRSAGAHDTLVYRLWKMLIKLNQGDSLDPQALTEEFGVSLRTIQRDLSVRFADLPLIRSGGRYCLEDHHLGKLTIKDVDHFASLVGVNGLFPKLTDHFIKGISDSREAGVWMVNGHHYEDMSGQSPLFTDMKQAIVERRHVRFSYNKVPGQSKAYRQVEPYKLINNNGVWYLAAWDDERLKSFSISKVEALRLEQTTFLPRASIDSELALSDGIWLGKTRQRVVIRVRAQVAGYFKRRKLLPNQLIEREFDGGDIWVSTTVAHADEVLPIMRYWIPHVEILEPAALQKTLEEGLHGYLDESPLGTR